MAKRGRERQARFENVKNISYENAGRRHKEKRRGEKRGSRGYKDVNGVERKGRGRLVEPKGGFLRLSDGSRLKDIDALFDANNRLSKELFSKGYSSDRRVQEFTRLYESYDKGQQLIASIQAKKERDKANIGKRAIKWLDNKVLDSNPVGRSVEKFVKEGTAAAGIGWEKNKKDIPDPIKAVGREIADKTKQDLRDIMEALSRGSHGVQNARLATVQDEDLRKGDRFVEQRAIGGVFTHPKEFWEGATLKKRTTGYDVRKALDPDGSPTQWAIEGLVDDIIFDPLNVFGIGAVRGASKVSVGGKTIVDNRTPKNVQRAQEVVRKSNYTASKALSTVPMKARTFRNTKVGERMNELGIKPGTKLSREDWEKVLNRPVDRTYKTGQERTRAVNEEIDFYRDLHAVLDKHALPDNAEKKIIYDFLSKHYRADPEFEPSVKQVIDEGLAKGEGHPDFHAAQSLLYLGHHYPQLMKDIKDLEFIPGYDNASMGQIFDFGPNGETVLDGMRMVIDPEFVSNWQKALGMGPHTEDFTQWIKDHSGGGLGNPDSHVFKRHYKDLQDFFNGVAVHELGHGVDYKVIDKFGKNPNLDTIRTSVPVTSDRALDSSYEQTAEHFSSRHYKEKQPRTAYDTMLDSVIGSVIAKNAPVGKTLIDLRTTIKEQFKRDIRPIEAIIGKDAGQKSVEQLVKKYPNLSRERITELKDQHTAILNKYEDERDVLRKAERQARSTIEEIKTRTNIDNIIEVIRKSSHPDRLGLTLRLMNKDVLTLRGSGLITDKIFGNRMAKASMDVWREGFESFEKYSRRVHDPALEIIRNQRLGGTSRVFQIYAKHYHKLFDGINPEARKAQMTSVTDQLNAGATRATLKTKRDKEIYDLFDAMLPVFRGKEKIGTTAVTLADITKYMPDTFTFDGSIKSVNSVPELINALGSGVPKKLDEVTENYTGLKQAMKDHRSGLLTKQINQLEKDRKKFNDINDFKQVKKIDKELEPLRHYRELIKNGEARKVRNGYKSQMDRLQDAVDKGINQDPLQAVWAARIAVEQAKGWVGLIEDIGKTFGVKRKGGKDATDIDKQVEALTGKGFKSVKGLDGYIFDPEVAQKVTKLMELFEPNNIHRAWELFDKATRAWKVSATLYNPGYYTRNMIGEITAGYFGGLKNPAYYKKSGQILKFAKDNAKLEEILKSHSPVADLLAKTTSKGGRTAATTKKGDKVSEALAVAMYHENNLITNFVNTEFHELGTHAGGVSKLGKPFVKTHSTLRDIGEVGENFPRMAHFLYALESAPANLSLREAGQWAASEVRKYHFDYSDVTAFEKAVMMRTLPFYKWTRKAMPMVVETLLANPAKISLYPKVMNAVALSKDEEYRETRSGYLPTYDKDVAPFIQLMLAYPVGKDAENNQTFFNINTPGFDGLRALFDLGAAGQLMLNPFFKTPIEQLQGEKLNEQFDKDGMQGRERISELFGQVPLSKQIDQTILKEGENKDSALQERGALMDEDLFSWATGLTAVEHREPFGPKSHQKQLDSAMFWGPYIQMAREMAKAKKDGVKPNPETVRQFNLFRRNNAEMFPHLKGLTESIDEQGNQNYNIFQAYNRWSSPFAKYANKDGSFDWDRLNADRRAGKLEKAD